ncbi:hypothetical protein COO60DRAFT_1671512 [Scenedesmus sp. NREL 46B-D3]|nr:hypothetical protein COO60DRAFT_1671512 [Scenedesmus sp. NREL 46B-D3]
MKAGLGRIMAGFAVVYALVLQEISFSWPFCPHNEAGARPGFQFAKRSPVAERSSVVADAGWSNCSINSAGAGTSIADYQLPVQQPDSRRATPQLRGHCSSSNCSAWLEFKALQCSCEPGCIRHQPLQLPFSTRNHMLLSRHSSSARAPAAEATTLTTSTADLQLAFGATPVWHAEVCMVAGSAVGDTGNRTAPQMALKPVEPQLPQCPLRQPAAAKNTTVPRPANGTPVEGALPDNLQPAVYSTHMANLFSMHVLRLLGLWLLLAALAAAFALPWMVHWVPRSFRTKHDAGPTPPHHTQADPTQLDPPRLCVAAQPAIPARAMDATSAAEGLANHAAQMSAATATQPRAGDAARLAWRHVQNARSGIPTMGHGAHDAEAMERSMMQQQRLKPMPIGYFDEPPAESDCKEGCNVPALPGNLANAAATSIAPPAGISGTQSELQTLPKEGMGNLADAATTPIAPSAGVSGTQSELQTLPNLKEDDGSRKRGRQSAQQSGQLQGLQSGGRQLQGLQGGGRQLLDGPKACAAAAAVAAAATQLTANVAVPLEGFGSVQLLQPPMHLDVMTAEFGCMALPEAMDVSYDSAVEAACIMMTAEMQQLNLMDHMDIDCLWHRGRDTDDCQPPERFKRSGMRLWHHRRPQAGPHPAVRCGVGQGQRGMMGAGGAAAARLGAAVQAQRVRDIAEGQPSIHDIRHSMPSKDAKWPRTLRLIPAGLKVALQGLEPTSFFNEPPAESDCKADRNVPALPSAAAVTCTGALMCWSADA